MDVAARFAPVEVFAEVACPFTHVGLRRFVAERAAGGAARPLVVRAWPLEWVNGHPLDAHHVRAEIDALRETVAPELFAGFVALEPVGCRERYREEDTAALARVPLLTLFGDYLEGTMWLEFAEEWRELSERLGAAGGDARHVALAGSGIRGNSHMLMMDRNSGEVADLILEWVRARA